MNDTISELTRLSDGRIQIKYTEQEKVKTTLSILQENFFKKRFKIDKFQVGMKVVITTKFIEFPDKTDKSKIIKYKVAELLAIQK